MTRHDKPTSIRLSSELKTELSAAASEEAIPFHTKVVAVLNEWLSKRLKSKAKPDQGIVNDRR